ncbi:MAG: peptidoglycan-binding protein [Clostridia bacterium]|nr:peptidoglycan-binding protein [Clostridia bacterium]
MPALEQGAVGNDVLLMQRRLKEYGFYAGDPNGAFDEVTRQAVASFQMVNSLSPTGVADGATLMRLTADSPITWPAFLAEMAAAEGDSGLNVYVLQKRLEEMDLFSGSCSGSFGSLTRQAVEAFQQAAGLEVTGEADSATWAALYARSASAQAAPQALRLGSAGDDVTTAQQRLNTLGFFDHEIDGEFGLTTQTAVRLFQMATDLEATGELDGATRARLMASDASSMMDAIVQRRFTMMLDDANDATQARIGQIAHDLIGTAFGTADDALYPGFPFVQYVCVAAGLPVTIPEDLIRMASRQVETLDAVENGDIVAFESTSADAVSMLLAVGAGEGRVICTTESGGWAELNFMDRMKGAKVYCWDAA